MLMAAPMGFTLTMLCPLTHIRRGWAARGAIAGIALITAVAWLDDFLLVVRDANHAQAIRHLSGWVFNPNQSNRCWMADA